MWLQQLPVAVIAAAAASHQGIAGGEEVWDMALQHTGMQVALMVSGASLYLRARRWRLRHQKLPRQGRAPATGMVAGEDANVELQRFQEGRGTARGRAYGNVVVSAGALVLVAVAAGIGPYFGHSVAPWRWPSDRSGGPLGLWCAFLFLAAAAVVLGRASEGARGDGLGAAGSRSGRALGGLREDLVRDGVLLVCFVGVAVDVVCRVTVAACCNTGNNCVLCSAGIISPMSPVSVVRSRAAGLSSAWWAWGMLLDLGLECLLAVGIARALDPPGAWCGPALPAGVRNMSPQIECV